jgi:hypothetical protein
VSGCRGPRMVRALSCCVRRGRPGGRGRWGVVRADGAGCGMLSGERGARGVRRGRPGGRGRGGAVRGDGAGCGMLSGDGGDREAGGAGVRSARMARARDVVGRVGGSRCATGAAGRPGSLGCGPRGWRGLRDVVGRRGRPGGRGRWVRSAWMARVRDVVGRVGGSRCATGAARRPGSWGAVRADGAGAVLRRAGGLAGLCDEDGREAGVALGLGWGLAVAVED